jgi:hypothetical protein
VEKPATLTPLRHNNLAVNLRGERASQNVDFTPRQDTLKFANKKGSFTRVKFQLIWKIKMDFLLSTCSPYQCADFLL